MDLQVVIVLVIVTAMAVLAMANGAKDRAEKEQIETAAKVDSARRFASSSARRCRSSSCGSIRLRSVLHKGLARVLKNGHFLSPSFYLY